MTAEETLDQLKALWRRFKRVNNAATWKDFMKAMDEAAGMSK